jgi:hypothetical protein
MQAVACPTSLTAVSCPGQFVTALPQLDSKHQKAEFDQVWWYMSIIPASWRQRPQTQDNHEFEAILGKVSETPHLRNKIQVKAR